MGESTDSTLIAWRGWHVRAPGDWRPLHVEDGLLRGQMMLGPGGAPIMLVKWWRPRREERFSWDAWIDKRLRKIGGARAPGAPQPPTFSQTAWSQGLAAEPEKVIWYGYAREAGFVLEVVVATVIDVKLGRKALRDVLPTLRATPAGEDMVWSFYSAGFLVPAGSNLVQRQLASGDVALLFQRRYGERILLRQIYPSELALKRRTFDRWLNVVPFKERRRFKEQRHEEWRSADGRYHGVKREGWKRIAFPLGFYNPRFSRAMIVEDAQLERLLMVEHMALDDREDPQLPERLTLGMNQDIQTV